MRFVLVGSSARVRGVRVSRAHVAAIGIIAVAAAVAAVMVGLVPRAGQAPTQASLPVAPLSFDVGSENTWIRLQNVGHGNASITIAYFDSGGRLIAGDGCPGDACGTIPPGQSWTFFQSTTNVPSGYRGSAMVFSDEPLVALQAKDVQRNGAFLIDGTTLSESGGSYRLYMPLVMNGDGPFASWSSRFVLQNLTDTTACVTLVYVSAATSTDVHHDPARPGSGGNRERACPNGGRALAPYSTLTRDPDSFGVAPPFTGGVRVLTHMNAQRVPAERQIVTATADTWNQYFNLFTTYRALTEQEMSTNVLLPVIERDIGPWGSFRTSFQIQTADSKPAYVGLLFEGYDMNTGQFVSKRALIGVAGSRTCHQASVFADNCLPPGDALPPNFSGTVRITATSPVGVIVSRGSYFYNFATYHGVPASGGAARISLPALNKGSWFRVAVADGGSANIRILYQGFDLPGWQQVRNLRADRELTVLQAWEPLLPGSFGGSAIVESDRPIIIVAGIGVDGRPGDRDLLYNGVPLR